MSVWANTEGNIVFNSQTSVTNADEFSGTRFQALYNIAQANFDDVKLRSDAPTKDGNLLVAALWDPITSVVYASTIPRGEFIDFMVQKAPTQAPVWWSRASDISPAFHAEDGAYFLMEFVTHRYSALLVGDGSDESNGKILDTLIGTRYAPGSKVAVWGYFNSDPASVKGTAEDPGTGRRIGLCGTTGAQSTNKPRNPTCKQLAGRLGVTPDPNADDPYPAELDEADLLLLGCDNTVLALQDPPPPGAPGAVPAPAPPPAMKARQVDSAVAAGPSAVPSAVPSASPSASPSVLVGTDTSNSPAAVTSASGSDACPASAASTRTTITISVSYDPTPLSVALPLDTETGACTGACSATLAAATGAAMTTFQTSVATAATSYGCSYQKDNPDSGVTSAYCICSQGQSTITAALPRNSAGDAIPSGTNSCPYTGWPGTAAIAPTTTLGPASTNIAACQVCAPVVVNEDSCTSIPNCTPQGAVATVSIGSSPVNVGTLTGTALYTSVSSALKSICPSVTQTTALTQCSGSATVPNIAYASGDDLATDGELLVTVDISGYNTTQLRDALINSLATSAQQAATGSNCYVPEGSAGIGSPAPNPKDTFCNSAWFYEANYFNPWWRQAADPGPTDFIHATIEFHTVPQSILQFVCDFIDIAIDALAIVEPEFIVADAELEEGINLICQTNEGKESSANTASGSNPDGTA